jgi:hypothetical protein
VRHRAGLIGVVTTSEVLNVDEILEQVSDEEG